MRQFAVFVTIAILCAGNVLVSFIASDLNKKVESRDRKVKLLQEEVIRLRRQRYTRCRNIDSYPEEAWADAELDWCIMQLQSCEVAEWGNRVLALEEEMF